MLQRRLKILDKLYLPSGLLDYRTEPLMLVKAEKDRKQANIQGIHCIIKTTTGNRRWGLGEFFGFSEKEFLSFSHLQFSTFWPESCTSISPSITSHQALPSVQLILQLTLSLYFHLPYLRSLLKHSEHITSTTSTHNVHCLAYTQAKDYSLVLWYCCHVDLLVFESS